jgi:hypothetical protein
LPIIATYITPNVIAVAEVIPPADKLRQKRIVLLLDRLTEDHRAEAREDFVERHLRDDAGQTPRV